MNYLATTIILALLVFLETSFLPHFQIFWAVPYITLAFIIALAVRYRGIFHFVLAFAAGMYLDFLSGGTSGVYIGTFVFAIIIGRLLFFRDTGYDASHSFFWLLGISVSLIYLILFATSYQASITQWQSFLVIYLSGLIQTFIIGFLIINYFDKYFDWLNKKSEEKHR